MISLIKHTKVSKPYRFFQSDFLERLTHIKLSHFLGFWLSVFFLSGCFGFFWVGQSRDYSLLVVFFAAISLSLLGWLRWTLVEYLLHRFAFHYKGNELIIKSVENLHRVHHEEPNVSTRLLFPLIGSVPVALLLLSLDLLFWGGILGEPWAGIFFYTGSLWGYILYDFLHWSEHFLKVDFAWHRNLRSRHMRHHVNPEIFFGVSTSLWDRVLGTFDDKPVSSGTQ